MLEEKLENHFQFMLKNFEDCLKKENLEQDNLSLTEDSKYIVKQQPGKFFITFLLFFKILIIKKLYAN